MKNFNIRIKNVITNIYERKDQYYVSNADFKILSYDYTINYGDIDVSFFHYGGRSFSIKINFPWIHIGHFKDPNIGYINGQGVCLGDEYTDQIKRVLCSENDWLNKQKVIKEILTDYFSCAIIDHWRWAHVPPSINHITKDDLFYCPMQNKIYHNNNMSNKIIGVSKASDICFKMFKDHESFDSVIYKEYKSCFYCGYFSKKDDEKCFNCERFLR